MKPTIAAIAFAFCFGALCATAFFSARGNCEAERLMKQAEWRGFAHKDPLTGECRWIEFRKGKR